MVLDAAIDPAMSTDEYTLDQAESLEAVLDDFLAWCQGSSSCPWHPTGDPTSALLALIDQSRQQAIPGDNGRSAGPGEIYDAVLAGMYAQSDWPTLANALGEAAAGNSSAILSMSDGYRQNGSSNGSDAAEAIFCLDHPVSLDASSYPALATLIGSQAPVFGPLLTWGLCGVAGAPHPNSRTHHRRRFTSDPGHRGHQGPRDSLPVGGQPGPRAPARLPVDLAGRGPCFVLLQRLREEHRPDLPDLVGPAAGRDRVHRLIRALDPGNHHVEPGGVPPGLLGGWTS